MFRSPIVDAAVIIFIALLIFGPKKLPQLGRGMGQGMREFKDGITGESKAEDDADEKLSLKPVNTTPTTGAAPERPAQPAAAPGREAGSDPRA